MGYSNLMHGQPSSKAAHRHHNIAQCPCYYHHHNNNTVCRHHHKQSWLLAAMCIATHLYKYSNLMHGQPSSKAAHRHHNIQHCTMPMLLPPPQQQHSLPPSPQAELVVSCHVYSHPPVQVLQSDAWPTIKQSSTPPSQHCTMPMLLPPPPQQHSLLPLPQAELVV